MCLLLFNMAIHYTTSILFKGRCIFIMWDWNKLCNFRVNNEKDRWIIL